MGIKTYLFLPIHGKNPLKIGNYTIFGRSQERHASKKFNNKCSENSRSQIVFRTDIFKQLSSGAPAYVTRTARSVKLVYHLR